MRLHHENLKFQIRRDLHILQMEINNKKSLGKANAGLYKCLMLDL